MKQYGLAGMVFLVLLFSEIKGEAQGSISFIENKKQWEEVVKFKSEMRGGALFFEGSAITYVFYDPEFLEKIAAMKTSRIYGKKSNIKIDSLVECYAYRMHFDNAHKNVAVRGHSPLREYHNYYLGNNPERWSTDVSLFEQVEYHNLYSGIDLFFYEKDLTYKYEFRIAPRTDVEQIVMRYEGADKLFLRKGSLIVKVGKHETEERKPYAYQIDEQGRRTEIPCDFVLEGKTVRFVVGDYDRAKELIIDPTLIFASYSGSTADNWGFTATYDNAGNLYGGGTVASAGYPTTFGCFRTTYGGGSGSHPCDIAITKFSADGSQRIYSTYLGGISNDVPHSMIVSENNELYILATTSSSDFPVTLSAYNTTFKAGPPIKSSSPLYPSSPLSNGIEYPSGACIVISRFNANGTQLLGSTFFGGSGTDGLSTDPNLVFNYSDEFRGEIQLDLSNNVYIVSSTSSIDLPVTANAFQRTYGGGSQDGLIAKFNYSLQNLLWCSYFGGSSADAIYSMTLDKNNDLYICGGTTSNNIYTTSGAIQRTRPGDRDGFISKIASNGNSILNSTYYGRAGYDQTYLITLDKAENVYIMGQTDTNAAAWIKNMQGSSKPVYSNGRGQFVSKLSNNLSNVIWSTSFGSSDPNQNISPTALMVDMCNNTHIAGWGGGLYVLNSQLSTFGLPTTSDALYTSTDGADFYFMSLEDEATHLLYATYYGENGGVGEHVDGGTSRFDKKGVVYQAVCAGCRRSNNFPTYPQNVVSHTNPGTNCNLGVIKLDYGLKSVVADFSTPLMACAPTSITFANHSQAVSGSTTYSWNFGNGITSTLANPSAVSYTKSGTYTIKLVVSDTTSCNSKDSIEKELVILANTKETFPAVYVCKGEEKPIGRPPASNVTYKWTPAVGLDNYTTSNPTFKDTVTRLYTLYVTNGQCTDTVEQWVYVFALPQGRQIDKYGCLGDSVTLKADRTNGASYFIFSNYPTLSDTLNGPLFKDSITVFVNQSSKNYYVYRTNGQCSAKDTFVVRASSFSTLIDTARHICSGDTVQLSVSITNVVNASSFTYQWLPSSAVTGGESTNNPRITLKDSAYIYVIIKNEYGCIRKDSVIVGVSNLKINPTVKDISCFGLTDGSISIRMSGGVAPYSYSWSSANTDTFNILANLKVGTYTVKVNDVYKCPASQTFKIAEPTKLSVQLKDTVGLVFCDDESTGQALGVGSGGIPPYCFSWITGDTTAFIDHLYPGDYFLSLTDKNGCEDTVTFRVRDTSDMEVTHTSRGITCFGDCDGNVSIQIIKAVDPTDILWKTGEKALFRDSLCAGVYDILVTDFQHCRRRIFPRVADVPPISVSNAVIVHPYCFGMKDGSITTTIIGGTPPYKYYWDGVEGDNILSDLTESGQYRLYITDSKDCEFDTIFVLPPYDTLSATAKVTHAPCEEVCLGKASVQVFGGVKPYYYDWSNGKNTPSIDSLCTGEYWVVVNDTNRCEIRVPVQINIDTTIFYKKVAAWTDSTEIYRSLSVTLRGTDLGNDFSYDWSPPDGLFSTKGTKVIAKPLNTIIYTYTVTDKYGCQKSDTLLITINDVICEEPHIFVPNTFSPNGDGTNDILYVRGLTLISVDFAIYDRWGERIFATKDPRIGWDGTYKGIPCQPGVYVYYLTATCIGGAEYLKKGNVTLMR